MEIFVIRSSGFRVQKVMNFRRKSFIKAMVISSLLGFVLLLAAYILYENRHAIPWIKKKNSNNPVDGKFRSAIAGTKQSKDLLPRDERKKSFDYEAKLRSGISCQRESRSTNPAHHANGHLVHQYARNLVECLVKLSKCGRHSHQRNGLLP